MMDISQMSEVEISKLVNEMGHKNGSWFYASDLNAAAELLRECEGSLVWTHYDKVWECSVPKGRDEYLVATDPTNPARAICEVWLMWREGQDAL